MRVVLDTNVWVSGLLFRGTVRKVVEAIADGTLKPVTSPVLLDEVRRVLGKPRFHLTAASVALIIRHIEDTCEIVSPTITLDVVKDDPTDNRVLECAVTARVDGIVSGDIHLRDLKRYADIPIWTPSNVVTLLTRK